MTIDHDRATLARTNTDWQRQYADDDDGRQYADDDDGRQYADDDDGRQYADDDDGRQYADDDNGRQYADEQSVGGAVRRCMMGARRRREGARARSTLASHGQQDVGVTHACRPTTHR